MSAAAPSYTRPMAGGRLGTAAAVSLAALALGACGTSDSTRAASISPASVARSARSHVAVIVLENREASEVIGSSQAPYLNRLARRYGSASASYAITHPSLPNYLALTSGSTQGVTSDCTDCQNDSKNLVDQLEAAGRSWRAYLQDVPRPCFAGAGSGGYAKKHNPFAYYRDVIENPARCRQLVGLPRLAADLRAGKLPDFAWITPNLCEDVHDCSLGTGDRFLARIVPGLLRGLGPRGYVVVIFDEGSSDKGCCAGAAAGGRVATVLAGPGVRRGARLKSPVDHYGVLRTIEQSLGLPFMGAAADPRNGTLAPLLR